MEISRKVFLRALGAAAAGGGASLLVPPGLAAASERAGEGSKRPAIAKVEVFLFSIPQKGALNIALGVPLAADNVLVRLTTDQGVTGYGESSPYPPVMGETQAGDAVLAKALAGCVKGRDPFAIPQAIEAMDRLVSGAPGIKAAFEMALWDICGQIAGQPIHRLLGSYRTSFETDQTVYLETPAVAAQKAAAIAKKGFRNVKLKLGEAPETDIARVRAVREAVGPAVAIRVDANQGWSAPDAVRALRAVEPCGVQFCEQPVPCWDWAGLRHIRTSVPVPIMADEAVHTSRDMIAGIRQDAMDMVNIKLMKTGGILEAVRIAHIAEAANIPCMVGSMAESRVALTAAAHVALSQPIVRYADLDAFLDHAVDPVVGGMAVDAGIVTLPGTPGLGLDVDRAFLAKLERVL